MLLAMALVLASCATNPPEPRRPNENKRVPINHTLPTEIQKVTR